MRKASSALAVGILAAALGGCASSANPQSSAAAGGPGSPAAAGTTASSSAVGTTETSAPDPTVTSSVPASTGRTSPTPSSGRSTSAPSKPKPKSSSSPSATTPRSSSSGTVPSSFGYDPAANSKAQIDAARAAAKADGREVLLDFGASWCGNCVAMDQAFHTSGVQAVLASSYHLVQIDVDNNMSLLSQIAPSSSGSYGLPVIVILSPSGATRVDTDKSGNPGFDASSFLAFLKKWAG
ncbi:thiol-disulfide isomerase/thioredoxin [Catenulispora sp. MAP12-49]|uniref:thioredoxin family protein n=1 Tax=Catenulispora sp. MAP12-49 TaxID=3156302 RepID=UPI003518C4F6